jgi:spheroidene monooxygenase
LIVTLSLYRHDGLAAKLGAFSQMGFARLPLKRLGQSGLLHWKLMGTGAGAGFSTWPNFGVYTLLCVWRDEASARAALNHAQPFMRLRSMAAESADLTLAPTQARGSWDGEAMFGDDGFAKPSGVIVALTRATLKLRHLGAFWARVPAISNDAEARTDRHFMMGMGEVPWLHQVTFSIWSDEAAMRDFAAHSATHGVAAKLAYANGWFRDSLFARFNLLRVDGRWPALDDVLDRIAAEAPAARRALPEGALERRKDAAA